MRRFILGILVCVCAIAMFGCSCSQEKETIKYGEMEGVAEGSVDLSGKEAKVNISNIKAKKGADIDYLSNVVVENEEDFPDLEIWVDTSAVDIFEPGDYTAKYTFKYDGKSVVHTITVTIIDDEVEETGSSTEEDMDYVDNTEQSTTPSSDSGNAGNGGGNAGGDISYTTDDTQNTENIADTTVNTGDSNTEDSSVNTGGSSNTDSSATTGNAGSTGNSGNSVTPTTTKNKVTTATTTTKNNATTATTKRQMITTSGSTTAIQNIGFAYIELLSGSTVSIKTTTAKYIVSTRTDVSYTTKNGTKYKVSELIIKYNTGDERVLETVEEKCN